MSWTQRTTRRQQPTKVRQGGGGKGRKGGKDTPNDTGDKHKEPNTQCKREQASPVNGKSHETKCSRTDYKPHQSGTSSSGDAGASRIFCSPHPFPHSPFEGIHNNDRSARVHASQRLQSQPNTITVSAINPQGMRKYTSVGLKVFTANARQSCKIERRTMHRT